MASYINNHGGGCCGMRHIYGFHGSSLTERAMLKTRLKEVPASRLAEVVLTDAQCTKARLDLLKENGFRYVCSFINGNTRRKLHIFHYHKGGTKFGYRQDTPPAGWDAPEETAVSGDEAAVKMDFRL